MTTLHDGLVDLADHAPKALPEPGLWERGTRYRRRRRRGSILIVALAAGVLGILASVAWVRAAPPAPVLPAGSPAGFPDRLFPPSAWLPGTNDVGPPGPLAAVLTADRASMWSTRHEQPIGISATTGRYVFLDLPGFDRSLGSDAALSPDGRHLAYWIVGRAPRATHPVVVGLAIYDPDTGHTRRHLFSSAYGFSGSGMFWAGDDAVVAIQDRLIDSAGEQGRSAPPLVWDLASPSPHPLTALRDGLDVIGGGPGFVLVNRHDSGEAELADLETGAVTRRFGLISGGIGETVVDPTGRRVALLTADHSPSPVSVGTISGDGSDVVLSPMPTTSATLNVLGWVDPTHLVVVTQAAADDVAFGLGEIDVTTGRLVARSVIMRDVYTDPTVAAELLGHTFHASPPPRPVSHRVVAGTSLVTILIGGWWLRSWRRRVRV